MRPISRSAPSPRLTSAAVVLGAFLVLTACAETARDSSSAEPSTATGTSMPSPSATLPSGWTEFVSPRYGYVIGVPPGWRIEEVAGMGGLHPGEPGTDSFTGDNRQLTVTAVLVPDGAAAGTWRSPIVEHYEGPEPAGHALVAEVNAAVTIDGREGWYRRYRFEIPPYEQLVIDAEVIVDGQAYLITYLGLGGLGSAYEAEFEEMLATFGLR